MFCVTCRAAREGKRGVCEACGDALWKGSASDRKRAVRTFQENDVVRKRLHEWKRQGLIDAQSFEQICATLEPTYVLRELGITQVKPEPVVEAPPVEVLAVSAAAAEAVVPEMTELAARDAPRATESSSDEQRERSLARADHDDTALESAGALFAGRGTGHQGGEGVPLAGALGALSLLDADDHGHGAGATDGDGAEVRSFLYENVGWFVGVLLVLAGSVYGVREAWRTLDGVARHAVVAGALLGYHAGFTGLARLLASRSRAAGAVLSAVAVGLLPIVFASLAAMVAASPGAGLALALPSAAIAFFTSRAAGKRFGLEEPARVSFAVLPSLVASLPLSMLPGAAMSRWLLPFAGAGALAVTAMSGSAGGEGPVRAWPAVWSALYAAVGLLVLSIVGAPDVDDAGAWLASGGTPLACVVLFAGAVAAVFADVCGRAGEREAHPKGAPAGEVLALGALASAAAGGAYVLWNSELLTRGAMVLSAGAAVLATGSFARASLRHPGAAHPTVWIASLAAVMCARVALPDPRFTAWWYAAASLGPAGSLVMARLVERGWWARRLEGEGEDGALAPRPSTTAMVLWGWLLGPLPVLMAGATEVSWGMARLPAAASAAAVIALGAAWSGGLLLRTGKRHYLAGLAGLATALAFYGPLGDAGAWARATALAAGLLGVAGLLYTRLARSDVREGVSAGEGTDPRDCSAYDDLSLIASLGAAACAVNALPTALAPPMAGLLFSRLHPEQLAPAQGLAMVTSALLVCLPATALLFARAQRDRTRLVSSAAVLVPGLALSLGVTNMGEHARAAGALAVVCALVAALRGREGLGEPAGESVKGRRVFGLETPWGARPRALALDGFAVGSVAAASVAAYRAISWAILFDPATRGAAVAGGAMACASAALWFFAPSARALWLNGRTATLVALGLGAALTGVINRLNRPLPPAAISVRFAVLSLLVWGVARALRAYGKTLAHKLDAPEEEGENYHLVPHAGVAAFAVLCLYEAVHFGSHDVTRTLRVVPPGLWFAGALGVALLANSWRSKPFAVLSILAAVPGAMALSVQRSPLGEPLVQLTDAGRATGTWVLERTLDSVRAGGYLDPRAYLPAGETEALVWQRGLFGAACVVLAAVLAYAVEIRANVPVTARWLGSVEADPKEHARINQPLADLLFRVTFVATIVLVCAGFFVQTTVPAALVMLGAVALSAALRDVPRLPAALFGSLSLAALVHAHAQSGPLVPEYTGPLLASLGLVAAGSALRLSSERIPFALWVARALYLAGFVYSLAGGAPAVPMSAAAGVLAGAFDALYTGAWLTVWPLGATAALACVGAAITVSAWVRPANDEEGAASAGSPSGARLAAVRTALWALAAAELFTARWALQRVVPSEAWADALGGSASGASPPGLLLQQAGSALALVGALVATASHLAARRFAASEREETKSAGRGFSLGRDAALVLAGAFAAAGFAIARDGLPPDPSWSLTAVLAALVLAMLVSAHAAWREASARHVYFVQAAVVGAYAGVRSLVARGQPPAVDAFAALGLGFVLLGVTVLARRAKIAPVADATRRFAAWLPVLAALVLPSQATNQAALAAAVAGALYGSFAVAERSRWLGTLAGVFINGALLVGALANGLDGVEVYLAPLGLFVLTLSQLFQKTLGQGARATLRIAGGLLLYLPAGISTALQLGDAATGAYAVAFGAACLGGIALGALLRIRAYLVLGALFLTLDVGANLAYAGIRDHRIGFAVLSGAGLLILGAMVASTLQRDRVRAVLARLRSTWSRWD